MTDDEFRDLIERAQQIRELTRTEGWQLIADRAAATIGAQQKRILGGALTSMEDYKKHVGWVEGAMFIINIADQVEAEVEREREHRREIMQANLDDDAA